MIRYFQDLAGTVPAVLPGQNVALIQRAAGTVDATQATALSRPWLARWPKGGRRNLLTWTEDLSNAAWAKYGGVSISADGSLGGVPAVKISDSNASDWAFIAMSLVGLGVGPFTAQVRVKKRTDATTMLSVRFNINDGSTSSRCGVHLNPNTGVIDAASGGWTYRRTGFGVSDGGDHWLLWVSANTQAGDVLQSLEIFPTNFNLAGVAAASNVGDNTIAAPQLEVGTAATPYQRVSTAYDVTEAGKPDIRHLWNDGGDSINAAPLPAGTYGLAYVDVLGNVTTTTVTSDGTTPINLLRTERQVDVAIRQGAFTAAEIANLTQYWGWIGLPPPDGVIALVSPENEIWVTPDGFALAVEA